MKLLYRGRTRRKFNKTPSNLVGPQMRVFVPWYQDRGLKPMQAVEVVRCLKRVNASEQDEIVGKGVNQLDEISPISDYDLIISVPSSFALVNRIIKEISSYDGTEGKIVEGLMYKLPSSDVMIDWDKAEREGSEKTIPRLESFYKTLKSSAFEIKGHAGSNRRYLYNFLGFNRNHVSFERLKTVKRILLIDDTYGMGVSMTEALRIIREVNPTVHADGFCLVHDFPCRTDYLKHFAGEINFEAA